jgi:hypothetical protein
MSHLGVPHVAVRGEADGKAVRTKRARHSGSGELIENGCGGLCDGVELVTSTEPDTVEDDEDNGAARLMLVARVLERRDGEALGGGGRLGCQFIPPTARFIWAARPVPVHDTK